MTTTTANKTAVVIVPTTVRAAGSAPNRGTLDVRTSHGGIVTVKFQNGATGPSNVCMCNVMIAHDTGPTPPEGSAGAVWKKVALLVGTSLNNGVVEIPYVLDKDAMHYCFEFFNNTAQAVTVEAIASVTTSYMSV